MTSQPVEDQKPPLFASWSSCYALVLLFLVVLILAFYLFSRFYE